MPLLEKFEALSFRLFGRFAPYFLNNVFHIKGPLEKGRVKIYPETYISMMFFTAATDSSRFSTGYSDCFALLIFYHFLFWLPLPLFVIAGFLVVPTNNASDRATSLEREIPFAAAYISVMAVGRHCTVHQLQAAIRS